MQPFIINSLKVTAIVSVYKAERFIRGCLEDLTAQTLFQQGLLEIIVVNSGSPDNEDAIIREYLLRYPDQLRYITTPERETIYQAWNRGAIAARGVYLTNANADDRHRPDALEIMSKALDAHPEIGLVYADSNVTREENATFDHAPVVGCFLWPQFDPRHLFQICYVGPQPMWRRSLHERYGLFDATFRSAGDYDFWLRLVAAGERFSHIRETLGLYLQSPLGFESSNQEISWQESAFARERHWPSSWGARPQPEGCYLIPCTKSAPGSTASQPLVSVIVPTCNRPELLAQTLRSILDQTYRNFEILVVNDAGVDVGELIDFLNQEGKIRYFNLALKVERSASRNLALRNARGKYIAYLDDDDCYHSDHLETLVTALENSKYKVAYTDAERVTLGECGSDTTDSPDIPYSYDFDPIRLAIENYIPILCLMHERLLLDTVGFFDETLSRLEDWDLWIRLASVSEFIHIPKVTSQFTMHLSGSTLASSNAPRFLECYKTICSKYHHLRSLHPDITVWQLRNVFHKTCFVYEYLAERLTSGADNESERPISQQSIIKSLLAEGIQQTRIESTFAWIHGRDSADQQAERWLSGAIAIDPENYPARMELVNLLLRQGRQVDAIFHLKLLLDANPGDEKISHLLFQLDKERSSNMRDAT